MNLNTLDITNKEIDDAKKRLYNDSIIVNMDNSKIKITNTLVNTKTFCDFLNNISISNNVDDTYLFFNHIQTNNDIFYENGKYEIKKGKENHPVRGVNWYGALFFCHILGGRLITSKEWEFISSLGKNIVYPWGNSKPNKTIANYGNNVGDTTDVKAYPHNPLGFYDLAGNLREWTNDIFNTDKRNIETYYRVVKGGAWDKTSEHLEIKKNSGKWLRLGTMGIGFRVVWDE